MQIANHRGTVINTKTKLVALLMMSLVVLTVFSVAADAATTRTPTQISLKVNNANPSTAQSVLFSGILQTKTTSPSPIANAKVYLHISTDNVHWTAVSVTVTGANGAYTFSRSLSAGTYYFRTYYAGTTSVRETFSPTIKVSVTKQLTQVSLSSAPAKVVFGRSVVFSGILKTKTTSPSPIANAKVYLHISTDNVHWTAVSVTVTGANGAYSLSQVVANKNAGTLRFRTYYAGSEINREAFSPTVVVTQTTQPIEYQVGLPPSMIDDGEIQYFGAHRFTTVYLVAGDTQPYTRELNIIKSLGMKPVIDVEYVIWQGSNANKPISSFASYFQSLKDAGWQSVASEGGRAGDPTYIRQFFGEYINYNIASGGLWQGIYKDRATTRNSWESYNSAEVPYIFSGTKEAAALGIKNGIMGGVWSNDNGNNQILTNSLNGRSPSYKSMLDWSYTNNVGFTSFAVWFHPGPGTQLLPLYKQLGFEQIVANLQASYPPSGSWIPPTKQATTLTFNPTRVASDTYTFSGSLRALATASPIANANVLLQVSTDGGITWSNMALSAGQNPTATDSTGSYSWTNVKLASGTYYFRTYYAGSATDLQSFAPSVHGIAVTV